MGALPSSPSKSGAFLPNTAKYLIGTFVGDKSFPLSSEFWQKLLELPFNVQWPSHRVHQACELEHLTKILFHLACYLQESMSTSGVPPLVYEKAVNAVYITSVFLKHLIESAQGDDFELYLSLDDIESIPKDILGDQTVENLVMRNLLTFIASVDVSPNTYLLHIELLNFMIIAMSTQLRCGPSPGLNDVNPFLDAAMAQANSLVSSVVHKLLLNYISRPGVPFNRASYSIFYDGSQSSVIQTVGSAAANIVLLPFSYLVSSSGEGSRSPIADSSLHVLRVLIHYHKCVVSEGYSAIENNKSAASDPLLKENTYFSDNPYRKAFKHATDSELDRVDVESNAHSGPQEVYLHTTCLATLANMAPHVHHLSAYASQRLISLFDMLSRKYNKLADLRNNKLHVAKGNLFEGSILVEDMSTELHIYADFLRLVLEIINAILTYALPQNPEVVYAIMHKQEVFQPFKDYPHFNELLENISTVLDCFNSCVDAQRMDGDWSVNEMLQVIIVNCRSWHVDGMKMFTQQSFTYEQESYPEEFFIPYVWQLILSQCGFKFNAGAINLFPVDLPTERLDKRGGGNGKCTTKW